MDKKNDRELLELLLEKVISMETKVDSMESKVDSVETKVESIDTDVKELKTGQHRIENKLDDIEVHNANRHIIISADIKDLKSTQSKMEIVTADNWSDIAKLKAARKHRIK